MTPGRNERTPAPPEDDVWLSVSWALEEEGNGRRGHSVPEDARWTAGATRAGQARRGGPAQAVSKDDARRASVAHAGALVERLEETVSLAKGVYESFLNDEGEVTWRKVFLALILLTLGINAVKIGRAHV